MNIALRLVLRWLANLPWSDFLRVVNAASLAGQNWIKTSSMSTAERAAVNLSRAAHVRQFIISVFPRLKGWKQNVILELAVAFINRNSN